MKAIMKDVGVPTLYVKSFKSGSDSALDTVLTDATVSTDRNGDEFGRSLPTG